MSLVDLLLGPALLMLGGIAVAGYGFRLRGQAVAMRGWPHVTGRISATRILIDDHRDEDGHRMMYRPEVRYEFTVDGQEYAAKRIGLGEVSASLRSVAEGVIARYPEGRQVVVFYNPDRPSDAILHPATAGAWASAAIGGGALVAVGGAIWALTG